MPALDTKPYWLESGPLSSYRPIDRDVTVDVAVIGGGITGITAAYLLKKAGKTVALLDRRRLAEVDTGHTTAHITYVTDVRLTDLEKNFGRDHARAVWDAGRAAMWQIESVIDEEHIDCDFAWVPGYLHAPVHANDRSDFDTSELRREAELAASLGFDAQFVDRVPLMKAPGIEFDGQALFHPRKYLRALVERIPGAGSYVFESSSADEVRDNPLTVIAGGHRITCGNVLVATHSPQIGKGSLVAATLLQTKLALYSTYAVAGTVPSGVVPTGSFWDTGDPYLYLRVDRHDGYDFAILGGEDHKTGQSTDERACYARLEQRLRALIPQIELTHQWSGQVIETNDGLPFIGETSDRQFTATGYGGNGMTFGTLAGMMMCDATMGRTNPWKELFDPGRMKIKGGLWDYLRENKDYPYYMMRDRFSGSEGQTLRSLRRGEGKILELDGTRVAAYRDPDGRVTRRSAMCTHMGCVVAWNTAERTWDCPCHGSRFAPDGDVLAGPAESPLPPA